MRPQRALESVCTYVRVRCPLVAAGAVVVNVDVSARYLSGDVATLALNGAPVDAARFVRMDARNASRSRRDAAKPFDLIIDRRSLRQTRAASVRPEKCRTIPSFDSRSRACADAGRRHLRGVNNRELAERDVLKQLVGDALPAHQTRCRYRHGLSTCASADASQRCVSPR